MSMIKGHRNYSGEFRARAGKISKKELNPVLWGRKPMSSSYQDCKQRSKVHRTPCTTTRYLCCKERTLFSTKAFVCPVKKVFYPSNTQFSSQSKQLWNYRGKNTAKGHRVQLLDNTALVQTRLYRNGHIRI